MEWIAFFAPPLLWAKAAFASPFLKTYRHQMSGMLSVVAGALMFGSLRVDLPSFPILFCGAGAALLVMFIALLWKPASKKS